MRLGIVPTAANLGSSVLPIGDRCYTLRFPWRHSQPEIHYSASRQFPESNFFRRKNADDAKVPTPPSLHTQDNSGIR
jgi:hypothetical protein